MKWTPGRIAEFRELAPTGLGIRGISRRLGVSYKTVESAGHNFKIAIARQDYDADVPPEDTGSLRARWATLIGPMKAALRAEIERGA